MAQRILTGVSHWRFPWLAVLALALAAAIAIPALNATTDLFSGRSAPVAQSEETGVSIGPAPVVNPPAQNSDPAANVPGPSLIPLYETEWTEIEGDHLSLLQNPNQLEIKDEKQGWFHENVSPNIQANPWFLPPAERLRRDGSPWGGLTALHTDGNVWLASLVDHSCLKNCDAQTQTVYAGDPDAPVTIYAGDPDAPVVRGTARLFLSFDSGGTWRELVPPTEYHQGNLNIPGNGGPGGSVTVFNEGGAARIHILVNEGFGPTGRIDIVYQTTVPANSPPAK